MKNFLKSERSAVFKKEARQLGRLKILTTNLDKLSKSADHELLKTSDYDSYIEEDNKIK